VEVHGWVSDGLGGRVSTENVKEVDERTYDRAHPNMRISLNHENVVQDAYISQDGPTHLSVPHPAVSW